MIFEGPAVGKLPTLCRGSAGTLTAASQGGGEDGERGISECSEFAAQ